MQFTLFTALVLALAGTTQAHVVPTAVGDVVALASKEAATLSAEGLPLVDLSAVRPTANVTLGRVGASLPVSARADSAATMLLCTTGQCTGCISVDMATVTHRTCIPSSFTYNSIAIVQPNNDGFSYAVFGARANCLGLTQIPTVNNCFGVPGFSAVYLG